MLRAALLGSFLFASLVGRPALADEDPRFAESFLQGLRDRGYHDLALEYLDRLRKSEGVPDELRKRLDYEEGRIRIDVGIRATDPDRARESFDQARIKLEAYIAANPDADTTSGAIVDLAQLLYERGRNSMIQADDARTPAEKDVRVNEARSSFAAARSAYERAFERLDKAYKAFDAFIPVNDPRFARRESALSALLNAELQRAIVDYEDARTYPEGSAERTAKLQTALDAFAGIHTRHRRQMAGIAARMWQGKCYEERGELGPAKAIYDELLQHPAQQLLPLQKKVDYFRILVMAKRKEHAAAVDECLRWLSAFPNDRRSYDALGIQLQHAKSTVALLDELEPGERTKLLARAVESLEQVVKVYSPFKLEAVALLKQISPKKAVKAEDVARLSFDDAVGRAEQAIQLQQYDEAVEILRLALAKNDAARDPAKYHRARYTQAFCLYMNKDYFESAVVAEHLARRFPNGEWSAKASEIGVAAMIDAYNSYQGGDRQGDLDRLVEFARYASTTWPDSEQGDSARMTVGQIALGRGRYEEAAAAFDSVRPSSARKPDAQAFSGDANWKLGLKARDRNATADADALTAKAIALYRSAIDARRKSGATDADLPTILNSCDLAGIQLEVGKPKEALALLDPIARELGKPNRPAALNAAYGRVLSGLLRAHVADGQVDAAIADMNKLEAAGGEGKDRAQLYFELGRLLEREQESLRKRGDKSGLERTRAAYRKFLDALVASSSGQTFESLVWAGGNLLELGAGAEAEAVFRRVLDTYAKDAQFSSRPGASDRLMLVRLELVAALRVAGKFDEADKAIAEILAQSPRLLQAQMEKGQILSAKASAKKGSWNEAFAYWQALAGRLRNLSPKPKEYFEAWYNAALALEGQGKAAQAKQTLSSVMRLSPTVGSAEMKSKYQEMIARIK
ncbi:MAG: tetratricopeptide repeat protein [Isosphaeraceae bacterium]|nr:tetratricopeptide repeat protein [Isosphaeraceae bacterium]